MLAEELSDNLRRIVTTQVRNLSAITPTQAAEAPGGSGWTRKEELGHLIDSATRNHIRIVEAALNGTYVGPSYDQDRSVKLHAYDDMGWQQLTTLWQQYNLLLSHLVSVVPETALGAECTIGDKSMTLAQLIADYVTHVRHHMDHILGRSAASA